MCMKLSIFARKKVANQPITCYKVVGAIPNGDKNKFMSFYYDWIYELGVVTYQEINRQGFDVEAGFHSYLDIKDAMMFKDRMGNSGGIKIVECIIPKNSEYYEGKQRAYTNEYNARGFVSNSLIIKRVF